MKKELYREQGPKEIARGKRAVCSSAHPIVTDTMLQIMRDGGNAIDAGIAGSLVQTVVQPDMTNCAGTVSCLLWEAKTAKAYQLNSTGTLVPDLPPFRPLPEDLDGLVIPGRPSPMACIPGFMPGLGVLHERFGTQEWSDLCAPAIRWAEEGHPISSFQYAVLEWELPSNTYFSAGRKLFTPDGFTPRVGERFRNRELAKTLKRLAQEGPKYFTEGDWARHFVEEANSLGWAINLEHLTANPPRWQEPLRFEHNGHVIIQLSPPERTGVFTALVLGVLKHLDVQSKGPYFKSPETLYLMAHALRWADRELGLLNDPKIFYVPLERWLSDEYHKMVAEIIGGSRPKVDLTNHFRLYAGSPALAAVGIPISSGDKPIQPTGSCELSIVDAEGNWVQMMSTWQSGGIPGAVIDGVPMVGSHARPNLLSWLAGWLVEGARIRSALGNTIVLRDGQPWLALGTPGYVYVTIPQVLLSILDFGMNPYDASVEPRMLALADDYSLRIESRLSANMAADLARMGIQIVPHLMYDFHMGSFQICWRDEETGLLNSSTDPRRAGKASGF
jgi:gamma-glutamyltranspeptidase/glutathione hydrolase